MRQLELSPCQFHRRQIDRLVYELSDTTDEEIAIVEGEVGCLGYNSHDGERSSLNRNLDCEPRMSITRDQISPYISRQLSDDEVRELIEQHIDTESLGTGIARARVRGTGTTVATVIQELEAVAGDVQAAAKDYDLTVEQVLAAVFFYWEHQNVIDAEITVRRSYFMD
jgi:uncharacterized protein (DUF433 family)